MTVSIAPVNIDYYLSTTANGDVATKRDLTAYYVSGSTPDGVWLGGGLRSLGITPESHVTTRDARALFEDGVNPLTGEQLGRHVAAKVANPNGKTPAGAKAKATRNRVGGFDLTFSVPKSVSALWALGDPHTQGMVYAAHLQAMKDTIGWIETNVLNTRSGHGGVAREDVTGVIASGYDHWESRNGDPQLHTHLVISNKVQRVSDGKWSTIDSNTLHKNVVTISETYNSLLFSELSRTLGTQVEARFDGA
ncbi:MAG: relaxase domain-containing protein, partial [Actinomycetales bacterium]|nr:relaxase domain-containing protein [Actinomycetales bacterium]